MKSFYNPLILSFLASISTLFGFFLIIIPRKYEKSIIGFSFSFAAGVMFCVSCFSLLPEAFTYLSFSAFVNISIVFFSFWLGIFLAFFVNKFLNNKISHDLYRIGIFSFISLLLHNIPEGILSFITSSYDIRLGLSIVVAIMFHNIPEGILIAIPIYYEFNDWKKAFLLTLIAGFSEFFGSILASFFFTTISLCYFSILLSITAGIMIYLSFFELIPDAFSYKNESFIIPSFLLGMVIMILCFILLK